MLVDVIMAIGVVLILAGALAVSLTRRQAVSNHLADSRAATRVAEQVLTALQSGEPLPAGDAETKIAVKPVAGAADVAGLRWVSVAVTRGGRAASLVGLARAGAGAVSATSPGISPTTQPAQAGGAK
jgi:type II secretory pathway pseudopilin PulG